MLSWVLLLLLGVPLAVRWGWGWLKRGSPPPGPRGLRASLTFLKHACASSLHVQAEEWTREFGDVFQVSFLGKNFVFLNSPEVLKTFLTGEQYEAVTNDRAQTFFSRTIYADDQGIAFRPLSEELALLRRMFHAALHHYGQGAERLEALIKEELRAVMAHLKKQRGPVCLTEVLETSLQNLLHIVLTGEEPECEDRDLIRHAAEASNRLLQFDTDAMLSVFPWLARLPGHYQKLNQDCLAARHRLLHRYFDQHQEKRKTREKAESSGFVDGLFDFRENLKRKGENWLTDHHIRAVISDFAGGGFITTRSSLNGFFLLMVHHPKVQGNIQAELDRVLGARLPTLHDRPHLPYLEAAILESMRYLRSVPIMLPHATRKDTVINGYDVSAGSLILANQWMMNFDPQRWADPETFRPERFLDEDGELLPPDHPTRRWFLPFGVGKRHCVGEALAKTRIFLYTAILLQHFRFLPAEGEALPSCESRLWEHCLVLSPPPYTCLVKSRSEE